MSQPTKPRSEKTSDDSASRASETSSSSLKKSESSVTWIKPGTLPEDAGIAFLVPVKRKKSEPPQK